MCVPIASAQVSWALSSSTFQPGPFISSNCPSRLVFLVVLQVCFHLSSISEFLPPAARRSGERGVSAGGLPQSGVLPQSGWTSSFESESRKNSPSRTPPPHRIGQKNPSESVPSPRANLTGAQLVADFSLFPPPPPAMAAVAAEQKKGSSLPLSSSFSVRFFCLTPSRGCAIAVVVHFRSTGNAPQLKQSKFKVRGFSCPLLVESLLPACTIPTCCIV